MIGEAIESVITQTYKDWELIIVNDCSTDNTLEVAQSYVAKDKRIRVFAHSESGTVSRAEVLAVDIVYSLIVFRFGKKASCCVYHTVTHDDCAVVQGSLGEEYRAEYLLARCGVYHSAARDLLTELGFTLYYYQSAGRGG